MTLEPLTMAHLLFAGMAIDSVGEQLATIEGFRYFQWSMVLRLRTVSISKGIRKGNMRFSRTNILKGPQ